MQSRRSIPGGQWVALAVLLVVGWSGGSKSWAQVAPVPLDATTLPSLIPDPGAVDPGAVDPGVADSGAAEAASQAQNLLKSGDRISIAVLGFPDLSSQNQIILADGTIQLPLVGNVAVSGLTPAQVGDRLTEALRPYVRRPQVSVALLSIRPLRVSVTGAVRRPGPLVVMSSNNSTGTSSTDVSNTEMYTLSYALVLAGGLTPNADLRNIVVRRSAIAPAPSLIPSPADLSAPATELHVDLWQILQNGRLASDLQLQDGDEIVVPTAVLNSAEQQQLLTSSLAPTNITIQIAGEVRSPGQKTIAANADVSTAVAAAGGLTSGADEDRIRLLRIAANGQIEQQQFEFGEGSIPLQEGDVLVVEKETTQDILDFVGQIISPISFIRWLF